MSDLRPLAELRVIITRAVFQAESLEKALVAKGATVFNTPTIRISPPANTEALDASIRDCSSYDWIVFTSTNAVRVWFDRRDGLAGEHSLVGPKFVAVGPTTERALLERADEAIGTVLVPERHVSEEIPALLRRHQSGTLAGSRILLPRSDIASRKLVEALEQMGASVDAIHAYRTRSDPKGAERAVRLIESGEANIITFTSASTVQGFLEALANSGATKGMRETFETASIGPVTSEPLRKAGIEPTVEASEHTVAGLVAAIVDWALRR